MLFHICLITEYLWCHCYLLTNENRNCELDETKLRYPRFAGSIIFCAMYEDVCFILGNCGGNKILHFTTESENFPFVAMNSFFLFLRKKKIV